MWQVLNNGKLAQYSEGQHRYWKNWANASFETHEEAVKYAERWFYPHLGHGELSFRDLTMLLRNPYKFNGYDTAQIVFVE